MEKRVTKEQTAWNFTKERAMRTCLVKASTSCVLRPPWVYRGRRSFVEPTIAERCRARPRSTHERREVRRRATSSFGAPVVTIAGIKFAIRGGTDNVYVRVHDDRGSGDWTDVTLLVSICLAFENRGEQKSDKCTTEVRARFCLLRMLLVAFSTVHDGTHATVTEAFSCGFMEVRWLDLVLVDIDI